MSSLRNFQTTGHDLFVAGLNNLHSGNLSTRNCKTMTITRSGSMLHRLSYDDLIETLIDGKDSNTKFASREILVHRSIYINTKAEAIVHAHAVHLIALSLSGISRFIPIDAEGLYYFPKGAPILTVTNAIASNEVAVAISPLLLDTSAVIVKGHGVFAIGETLEEACNTITSLEHSARIVCTYRHLDL